VDSERDRVRKRRRRRRPYLHVKNREDMMPEHTASLKATPPSLSTSASGSARQTAPSHPSRPAVLLRRRRRRRRRRRKVYSRLTQ